MNDVIICNLLSTNNAIKCTIAFNTGDSGQSDTSSGFPKVLNAIYTFLPLEIQIKERTESE